MAGAELVELYQTVFQVFYTMCFIPFHLLRSRLYYESSSPQQPPVILSIQHRSSNYSGCVILAQFGSVKGVRQSITELIMLSLEPAGFMSV